VTGTDCCDALPIRSRPPPPQPAETGHTRVLETVPLIVLPLTSWELRFPTVRPDPSRNRQNDPGRQTIETVRRPLNRPNWLHRVSATVGGPAGADPVVTVGDGWEGSSRNGCIVGDRFLSSRQRHSEPRAF
jgi:hypothetical protein